MDCFYDSEENIAWGKASLKELKDDLKKKPVKLPLRRHSDSGCCTYSRLSTQIIMDERGSGTKPDNSGTSVYFTPNETLQPETTSTKNEEFLEKLANVVEGEISGDTNSTSTSSSEVTDSLEEVVKILVNNSLISSLPNNSASAAAGDVATVSSADGASSGASMDIAFSTSGVGVTSSSVYPSVDTAAPVAEDATPVAEDATPVAEDVASVAEDAAPVAENAAPVGGDAAPVAGDAAPVAGDAAPVAEDAASSDWDAASSAWDTVSSVSEDVAASLAGDDSTTVDGPSSVSTNVILSTSVDPSVDTASLAAGNAASSAWDTTSFAAWGASSTAAVDSGSSTAAVDSGSSTAESLHSSLNESSRSDPFNQDISNYEEHNEVIEISSDSDIEVLNDSYGNLKGEKRSRTPDNQAQKCKSPKVQKCFQSDSDEEDGIPYQEFMRIKRERGFYPPLKDSLNGRSSENNKHIDQEDTGESDEESSKTSDSGSEVEEFSDTEELSYENNEECESVVEEVSLCVNNNTKEDSQNEEMPHYHSNRDWDLQTSSTSLVLNDTLDEVNMVCKQGLDYKVPESTSSINGNGALSKPVIKIPKSEINKKPQKSSKFDYIQSPIADYIRKKSPKLADFKKPVKLPKATLKQPSPAVHTNQLKGIVSPVGVYIKNSSEARLKQNIPVKSVANLFKSQTPTETTKRNRGGLDCGFPQAVYQPPNKTVTLKKKEITLPSNIKKLVKESTIEKHERRICKETSCSKKLLEEDLTISAADIVNTDVSYVSKKQAFIE